MSIITVGMWTDCLVALKIKVPRFGNCKIVRSTMNGRVASISNQLLSKSFLRDERVSLASNNTVVIFHNDLNVDLVG